MAGTPPSASLIDSQGRRLVINRDSAFRIGREPDNSLVLDDTTVSRYHAVIEPAGTELRVRDLGSANGTFVNGRRVLDGGVILASESHVRFGRLEYRFSDNTVRRPARSGDPFTSSCFCTKCGGPIDRRDYACQRCAAPRAGWNPRAPALYEPIHLENRSASYDSYGGFWIRFLALLIDNVFLSLIELPIQVFAYRASGVLFVPLTVLSSLVITWIYFAAFESSEIQGTPGKWILGLAVTDARGRRISFRQANIRSWGKILSDLTLGIGYLMAAWSPEKRALHDHLADTYVHKLSSVSSAAKFGYLVASLTLLVAIEILLVSFLGSALLGLRTSATRPSNVTPADSSSDATSPPSSGTSAASDDNSAATGPTPDIAKCPDVLGQNYAAGFETSVQNYVTQGRSTDDAKVLACGDLTRSACVILTLPEQEALSKMPIIASGLGPITPAEKRLQERDESRVAQEIRNDEEILEACQKNLGCEQVSCDQLSN